MMRKAGRRAAVADFHAKSNPISQVVRRALNPSPEFKRSRIREVTRREYGSALKRLSSATPEYRSPCRPECRDRWLPFLEECIIADALPDILLDG
jgi:hypothetical protein